MNRRSQLCGIVLLLCMMYLGMRRGTSVADAPLGAVQYGVPLRIAAFGDSLTAGEAACPDGNATYTPYLRFLMQSQARHGVAVIANDSYVYGKPGISSSHLVAHMRNKFDGDLKGKCFHICLIMSGTNDAFHGLSSANSKYFIEGGHELCRGTGAVSVYVIPPPARFETTGYPDSQKWLCERNESFQLKFDEWRTDWGDDLRHKAQRYFGRVQKRDPAVTKGCRMCKHLQRPPVIHLDSLRALGDWWCDCLHLHPEGYKHMSKMIWDQLYAIFDMAGFGADAAAHC